MQTENVIITRQLPKTNMTTVLAAGDDGTYQAGWWKGKTVANNRTRFIAKTINGDAVVIDNATGLMWPAGFMDDGANGGLETDVYTQITYANSLTFAGYSDWRMPNINELLSIVDFSQNNPALNTTFFKDVMTEHFWTSTKYCGSPDAFWIVLFILGDSSIAFEDNDYALICVRGGL